MGHALIERATGLCGAICATRLRQADGRGLHLNRGLRLPETRQHQQPAAQKTDSTHVHPLSKEGWSRAAHGRSRWFQSVTAQPGNSGFADDGPERKNPSARPACPADCWPAPAASRPSAAAAA